MQTVSAPSLFETPPELVRRIMDAAEIESGHRVLEPSAGTGRLVRAAFERSGSAVECVESVPALAEALRAAGYSVRCCDFLEVAEQFAGFHRIVMNPPFERGQDREHVRHAFGMLKPGGRLVSVMSPGPFFRQHRADKEFRDWFEEVGGTVEELPAGTFKESGTGVASRLVVIEKAPEEQGQLGLALA